MQFGVHTAPAVGLMLFETPLHLFTEKLYLLLSGISGYGGWRR